MRVSTGAGMAVGRPIATGEGSVDGALAPAPGPVVTGRLAWYPLQVPEELGDNRVEIGGGYEIEAFPSAEPQHLNRHGIFLVLDHYPWQRRIGHKAMMRMTLRGAGEFLVTDRDEFGGGASLMAGFELVRWADVRLGKQTERGVAMTRIRGAHGLGLEIGTSYRNLGDAEYWAFTASFTLRSPSIVGVAFRSLGSFMGWDPPPEERR